MNRTRVLLVDDHSVMIEGLVSLVRQEFEVVGTAMDGRGMLELAKKNRPDVIVTDITMPQLNGIDAVRMLRKETNSSRVLFLTMHTDLLLVEEAFRVGAAGYVLKACGVDELIKAIRTVAAGDTYITPLLAGDLISTLITVGTSGSKSTALTLRQRQVLQLLAEGKTVKEVAANLNISPRTAESHKYEIMRLLGVRTTAEIIRYAIQIKLV
jgi:DNA-binding NarL/FixJ family response regulator